MTKRTRIALVSAGMTILLWHAAAQAGPPKDPVKKCAPDAVVVGPVCMDRYEVSLWRVPNALTTNAKLVKAIKKGKATQADLTAAGATQVGLGFGDLAPCTEDGQNCVNDIYAVSLAGVTPAAIATWFQAQTACANASKRLPSNAEWQMAVVGTPDPGPDNGTTDCNTTTIGNVVATGSRSNCVSAYGAFDMVGNLYEWVADWGPRSTGCGTWTATISPTSDAQCLAGAATTGEPGVLVRGGNFLMGTAAGPFAVQSLAASSNGSAIGFRCAR
jgi:formylglycine-generating enzyme required for sulfatase activity